MVGWQPNYSNPDFIRMDREFRRKARMRRMLMRKIYCIIYIIITLAIMILIPFGGNYAILQLSVAFRSVLKHKI
jgi:hypothetical protein